MENKNITKDEFFAYEGVRKYGAWNMFETEARRASGLDKNTYFNIIHNYTQLKKKYKEIK